MKVKVGDLTLSSMIKKASHKRATDDQTTQILINIHNEEDKESMHDIAAKSERCMTLSDHLSSLDEFEEENELQKTLNTIKAELEKIENTSAF